MSTISRETYQISHYATEYYAREKSRLSRIKTGMSNFNPYSILSRSM